MLIGSVACVPKKLNSILLSMPQLISISLNMESQVLENESISYEHLRSERILKEIEIAEITSALDDAVNENQWYKVTKLEIELFSLLDKLSAIAQKILYLEYY